MTGSRVLQPQRAIPLTSLGVARVMASDVSTPYRRLIAVTTDESDRARLVAVDLEGGTVAWAQDLPGRPGDSIQVSPDGALVAVSCGPQGVAVHEADTGRQRQHAATNGPAGAVAWRPEGTGFAVAVAGQVERWDASATALSRSGTERAGRSPTEGALAVAYAPSGDHLAIGTNNPAVYISRVGAQSRSLSPLTTAVGWLRWNGAGSLLAVGGMGAGGAIAVFAGAQASLDDPFGPPAQVAGEIPAAPMTVPRWFGQGGWDPAGELLAVGASDGSVLLWRAASNAVDTFAGHAGSPVTETHWCDDVLVTVGGYPDRTVGVWGYGAPQPPGEDPAEPLPAEVLLKAVGPRAAEARLLFDCILRGPDEQSRLAAKLRLDDALQCRFTRLSPGRYWLSVDTKADVAWPVSPRRVEVAGVAGRTEAVEIRFG